MADKVSVAEGFVAVRAYEAVYETRESAQSVVIELRAKSDSTHLIFTIIDGTEVRASSIQSLVLKRIDCVSLTLIHQFSVLWNSTVKKAILKEAFIRDTDISSYVPVKLSLIIDGETYTTIERCDSFTEAMQELHERVGTEIQWRLQTCFDCEFCWSAFLYPTSDRDELRCYRDAPEAFKEIQTKRKFSSQDAIRAGHYFVHALHTCAAWSPLQQDT